MIGQHRRLHTRGFRILEWVALLSLLRLQGARAQDDTAPTFTPTSPEGPLQTLSVPTCTQADFLASTQGSSVCLFLSNVMTKCTGSPFPIGSVTIQPLGRYAPPGPGSPLISCQCAEASYNLFSGCAACQVGDNPSHWTDHATWFANCPNQSQIPKTPPGTPGSEFDLWMTSVFNPNFNFTQARDVVTTGEPPPAPSGDTLNGSTASGSTASSSSSSPNNTNTPIIVGVVVGVIGLLALLALALFLIRRRQKKSRVPPSAEFMKYAQHDRLGSVNLPTSSYPLMGNIVTADEEEDGRRSHTNLRGSVIKLDGTDTSHDGGGGGTAGTSAGMSGSTERDGAPPAFTPGLFKDPIFEKGVALNLAGMGGQGPASGSPVTYSPATPSSMAQNPQSSTEKQRLIQSRHGTA